VTIKGDKALQLDFLFVAAHIAKATYELGLALAD
jgi:hypothetical protein